MSTHRKTGSSKEEGELTENVDYEEGFHFFYAPGDYAGKTALSLVTFELDLETVDIQSIRYHLGRADFQKWVCDILGDEKLAKRIDEVAIQGSDEEVRKELVKLLQERIRELADS